MSLRITKARTMISLTAVCLILGLMLSWQYKSVSDNNKLSVAQVMRLEDLKDQLIAEKDRNDNLIKRNQELVTKNSQYENAQGNYDLYTKNLKAELSRARVIAGFTDVKGKGIVITIANSDAGFAQESDIISVLNELKAADAEAISVNGERIVAMSEVREAGGYIIINGKQMLAPFEIKAISDPDKLDNALKMVGGVIERLQELYKLDVKTEKKDEIIVPKIHDDGSVIKTDLLKPVSEGQ